MSESITLTEEQAAWIGNYQCKVTKGTIEGFSYVCQTESKKSGDVSQSLHIVMNARSKFFALLSETWGDQYWLGNVLTPVGFVETVRHECTWCVPGEFNASTSDLANVASEMLLKSFKSNVK